MMYLAAKKEATSFFGKVIKVWTYFGKPKGLPSYCHVELVFSDGSWFSSREFKGATSFVKGPPPGERMSMYDFFPLPVSPDDEYSIREWCRKEQWRDDGSKCGYDVRGVLFSFLPIPIGWQSAQDWFCSEVCCAVLQTRGWFSGYSAASVHPNQLVRLYQNEILQRRLATV